MNTIFVGGSRRISHLPAQAKDRLNNVIGSGLNALVGDANGDRQSDLEVFSGIGLSKSDVFCSGGQAGAI